MNKSELIKPKIIGTPVTNPQVSVIIVTYNIGYRIIECLDALNNQVNQKFEILLINNGKFNIQLVKKYNLYYIDLKRNDGPSYARNVGAALAKAPILAFLDDDAIPDKKWVGEIRKSLESKDVIGVRGKIEPNRSKLFNLVAGHYNLGKSRIKCVIGLEGNCGFKRKEFLAVGGFDPKLFGAEGINLTYRISKYTSSSTIYNPSIIIAHDYADSLWHFIKKSYRHGKNQKNQERIYKDLSGFISKYTTRENTNKHSLLTRIKLIPLNIVGTIAFNLGSYLTLFA